MLYIAVPRDGVGHPTAKGPLTGADPDPRHQKGQSPSQSFRHISRQTNRQTDRQMHRLSVFKMRLVDITVVWWRHE